MRRPRLLGPGQNPSSQGPFQFSDRLLGLVLILLGFLLSLRAAQFGLFTYEQVGDTIEITGYPQDAVGPVEIPAVIAGLPVTSIGDFAFYHCTGLTSVTFPSGLTNIGYSAFESCTGLTNVTIPASVTSIGYRAFYGCTGLSAINVDAGNPTYASDGGVLLNAERTVLIVCPAGKAGPYAIPAGVTAIPIGAFANCTGLTHVTIPSSVTNISSYSVILPGIDEYPPYVENPPRGGASGAFYGCTGLTSVTIPSSVTHIGHGAFLSCSGLTSVILEQGLTGIGFRAFYGCTGLTNVNLPSSLTGIDREAFAGCVGLTNLTLPASVTAIGRSAFEGCTGLTSVTIAANVASIALNVFSGCTSLTSITLPAPPTRIGDSAFHGCTGLPGITIPSSVTSIGGDAFWGCTGLTRATFLGDAPPLERWYGVFPENAPGFAIYYLSRRQGFTSPTWRGHPATRIDEATYPAAAWLLKHELWYDTQLNQDPNGDGVDLLTAYALNLDPRLNLQGRLPAPALGEATLSLSFHASSPGITYRVETSTNLTHWTTTGVTQSAPGADGRSTASVPRDEPSRFLRLVFED